MKKLIAPVLALVIAELSLHALFAAHTVSQVLGAARPSVTAALLLFLFFLVRLFAFFIAPGWLLFALGRLGFERLRVKQ